MFTRIVKYTFAAVSFIVSLPKAATSSVYLTILVNTGVLGLVAFVLLILSQVFKLLKIALSGKLQDKIVHGNTYYYILSMGVLAYAVQDFFNLWVVIVTPIYFVTMGMLENVKENKQ